MHLLHELREHCRSINNRTIKAAQAKLQQQREDPELLEGVWTKMLQDQQKGFIGECRDLDSVDLDSCLLVDSFGVWERHAEGVRKIRVISSYRSNEVNAHAWVPSKMRYTSYDALKEASSILKDSTDGMLQLGKLTLSQHLRRCQLVLTSSGWGGL